MLDLTRHAFFLPCVGYGWRDWSRVQHFAVSSKSSQRCKVLWDVLQSRSLCGRTAVAGPGGKRLPLGNHPFKQSTRDKQMQCCLNSVRYTCEELVPHVFRRTLPDVTFSSAVLRGRLCAESVHVSLLQKFNNLLIQSEYRNAVGKVIFFLKLGTFHRKHVPFDCNSFSKIANPRFIWLGKFGLAHACSLIFILDWVPFKQTLSITCGRFIGEILQELVLGGSEEGRTGQGRHGTVMWLQQRCCPFSGRWRAGVLLQSCPELNPCISPSQLCATLGRGCDPLWGSSCP